MHDLWVKHDAVEVPFLVSRYRKGRIGRGSGDREPVGKARDLVAMAHPDGVASPYLPYAVEKGARPLDGHVGAAKLAFVRMIDGAAELQRHRLLAVADRQHWHAGGEDRLVGARARGRFDAGRAAGEDYRLRRKSRDESRIGPVERMNLAINACFPQTTRDQLRHLGSKIDDQDAFVEAGAISALGVKLHGRGLAGSGKGEKSPIGAPAGRLTQG